MSQEDKIHSLALALVPAARKRHDETESQRRTRKALAGELEELAWDIVESEQNQDSSRDELTISDSIRYKLSRYAVDGGIGSSVQYDRLLNRLKSNPQRPKNLNGVLDVLDQLSFRGRGKVTGSDNYNQIPSLKTPAAGVAAIPRSPLPKPEPTPPIEQAPDRRVMSPAERIREWKQRTGRPEVPQEELLRDTIYLLQGINGNWVRFEDIYVVPEPFEGGAPSRPEKALKVVFTQDVKGTIPPSKRQLIHQVTELGRLYRRINEFVEEKSKDLAAGLAMQSLCHFIQREMTEYYRMIAVLEAQLNDSASKADHADGKARLTLRRVLVWTQDILLRMRLLSTLIEQCQNAKGGALASIIHSYTFNGDPLIQGMTAHLLEDVSRPFFESLSKWIFEGELHDPFGEFFVQSHSDFGGRSNEPMSALHEAMQSDDAASFWQHRFSLRTDMLPSFLDQELARKIFSTGKSLNFIRYACGSEDWIATQNSQHQEVTALQYSDLDALHRTVNSAHKKVSKHLVDIFLNKLKLLDHLRALQDYLMLGKGDFVDLLKGQLEEYLNRPSNTLHRHNLTIALETAIRGSNAQNDDPDIVKRLDARLLEDSAGDTGWDVFTLEYKVDSPVNTILDGPAMQAYQLIFGHLWRIKRVEVTLAQTWSRTSASRFELQKMRKKDPRSKTIEKTLDRAMLLLSEMNHMIRQLQGFYELECAAYSWQDLTSSLDGELDLDELISRHQKYVNALVSKILLRQSTRRSDPDFLANEVRSTSTVILAYCAVADDLSHYILSFSQGQQQDFDALDRIAARMVEQSLRFKEHLRTIIDRLEKHSNLIVRELGTRLNFNEHYEAPRKERSKSVAPAG